MNRSARAAVVAVVALAVTLLFLVVAAPSHAATVSHRWHAYAWAESHAGAWYVYGGTGPGFDCSGLVYSAYRHSGFAGIPRTTYSMLGWGRLRRETHAQARMGDIVFYGSGHVELYAGRHTTFGALEPGTRVGWHHWYWSSWWRPSAYFHVIGAG